LRRQEGVVELIREDGVDRFKHPKNRVFLIYKKLLYELYKVAQEQGRTGDMGMRWGRR